MKKVALLIVYAILVSILSDVGYYTYGMDFANISIKLKPNTTYSYSNKAKIEVEAAEMHMSLEVPTDEILINTSVNLMTGKVVDMDIQHDGSLSKKEEEDLKRKFKYLVQKEFKGAIKDLSNFSYFLECKLKFIPKILEQNYVKEANIITERCYEKEAGKIQNYSNRKYKISDKKAGMFKSLIDTPYCLDFCDDKEVNKGQTVEGVVYSNYINERLKEIFDDDLGVKKLVPANVEYKVEDINSNTVKLKLSGSYGPIEVEDESTKAIGILEGTISGNIWYDRKKRIFTNSELNMPMVFTFEISENTYEYIFKGKIIIKLSVNVKETMDLLK